MRSVGHTMNCSACRGHGPLKNSMDVINAAKKISEVGSKLDKLCRQIADQVNNVQLQITIRSK